MYVFSAHYEDKGVDVSARTVDESINYMVNILFAWMNICNKHDTITLLKMCVRFTFAMGIRYLVHPIIWCQINDSTDKLGQFSAVFSLPQLIISRYAGY